MADLIISNAVKKLSEILVSGLTGLDSSSTIPNERISFDIFTKFLFLSFTFAFLFCFVPYLILVFIFFINNLVFPSGIMDAYRTGAFLVLIACIAGFTGVFLKHAKRLVELTDDEVLLFEPILRRLSINYLIGMIIGVIALSILKSKTILALAYNNDFQGVPEPTEHAVFLVAIMTGLFSTELLKKAEKEVSTRLNTPPNNQPNEAIKANKSNKKQ